MIRVGLIDLDGIMVDFIGGALRHHKRALPYRDIRWDFHEQLGFAAADFYAPFGFEFWRDLAWHNDGLAILRFVEDIFGVERIAILSSPCDTVGCDAGKRAWIERHIPRYRRQAFLGFAKHLMAGQNKFLIDDHDVNVDEFRSAGGHAVLVPRPWNRRRDEVTEDGSFDIEALADELLTLVRG